VEPCLQSFQKHDDGRTLDLVDEHGELIATTFVPVGQESVLERVAEIFQDLLSTSHKGIEDTSAEGQEAPQEDEAEEQSQSERWEELEVFGEGDPHAPGSALVNLPLTRPKSLLSLNDVTFGPNIHQQGATAHWIVFFCYDWWDHCQRMTHIQDELAAKWQRELNTDIFAQEVRFAKVNCGDNRVLCNEENVVNMPTVFHYSRGTRVGRWSGGQKTDADRLRRWVEQQMSSDARSKAIRISGASTPSESLSRLSPSHYLSVLLLLASTVAFACKFDA